MSRQINVLMTGGGAPGAAGIIKCLLAESTVNLFVADANPSAYGKHLHDPNKFVVIPSASQEDFHEILLKLALDYNIDVILPLVTRELFVFSKYKKYFENAGVRVLVSDQNALNTANDKGKLYNFLYQLNHPVPQFEVVASLEQFENAVKLLGFPTKPVCFKPSISNGSRGFRIISNTMDEYNLLFNEKPNNTFITYEKIVEILTNQTFPELLVSEFLPGEEYSVDCIAHNGEPQIIVPRLRTRMLGGISVEGQFIYQEELISQCRSIIKLIGLHGNIGIQFKKGSDGKFYILEINPRVQGTIVSALGAGVNLPLLAIKQEMGEVVDFDAIIVKWGVQFSRYWNEVYY